MSSAQFLQHVRDELQEVAHTIKYDGSISKSNALPDIVLADNFIALPICAVLTTDAGTYFARFHSG